MQDILTVVVGEEKFQIIQIPTLAFYYDWSYSQQYDEHNNPKIRIYWETEDNRVGGIVSAFIKPSQFEILGKLSDLDPITRSKICAEVTGGAEYLIIKVN